jgi:hypothetical protein
VTSGGGHASGSTGWLHFGLGDADLVELRVIWPDGTEGDWQALPAGTFQILQPGTGPKPWKPGEVLAIR